MSLLQVVVNNAVSKVDSQPETGQASGSAEVLPENDAPSDTHKDPSALESNQPLDIDGNPIADVPSLGVKESMKPYDILSQLPETDLRNLCGILAHEGCASQTLFLPFFYC